MKINAAITLLVGADQTRVEIRDLSSRVVLFRGILTPANMCSALSRLAETPFESAEVGKLDRVGKQQEHEQFEFPMPPGDSHVFREKEVARETVEAVCPEGWVPDMGFDSKGSFFEKDDKRYARTIIRRWVKMP